MALKDYVLEQKEYLTSMRQYFHAHPEVSLQEYHTCERIEKELDLAGIPHRRVGETGVYAWIDGKKETADQKKASRIMVLRADIDALAMEDLKTVPYHSENPGVCHACGHDGHTASLLAAARILKERENEFSGEVRLFFQQAEEIGQGARQFVAAGLLKGVDRILGAHVTPSLEVGQVAAMPGPINASCDYFCIRIKGKGAHVSKPHLGIDALYIASQIVVALQSIVARSTDPMDSVVVGVGKAWAGTQYNIVAEEAELEGTTRAFTPEVRAFTNKRVKDIAEQTAALYGAACEVNVKDYSLPLITDAGVAAEVRAVAQTIVGPGGIVTDYPKSMQAEDFADYMPHCRGAFVYFGTRSDKPGTEYSNHNGHFDIDERGLLVSCSLYVNYALWVLNDLKD